MAEELFDTDPNGALAWARSASTAEGKSETLRSAVGRWLQQSRSAASAWLKSAPLSAEERTALKGIDPE